MPKIKHVPSAEIGSSGLNRWGGIVTEEFLTELQGQRGRRVYDEMRHNDAIVGAILFAVEMALREVPWFTQPATSKQTKEAEFLLSCMHDMSFTWSDFITDVLMMLPHGYSWFEIVYKIRDGEKSKYDDGLIGWRKIAHRPADSLHQWEFDEAGGIKAFIQMAPPDYKVVTIPIEKSILFRTKKEKNNPEGKSILRTAYRAYYFKKNLEALEGISLERVYAGLPVIKMPQGASTGAGATDETKAKEIVRKVRVDEQMGVVLPQGWELTLAGMGSGRGLDAYHTAILRYRQEIMLTVMATFIALGVEKAGSYALARETKDFFQLALTGWLNNICETLNEFAVPKLLKLNGFDPLSAQIKAGKVGQIDLEKMSNYIMRLATVGALTLDEQLEKYLREAADLPPKLVSEEKVEVGKGGEGSGFFGHAGRAGELGGSAAAGGGEKPLLRGHVSSAGGADNDATAKRGEKLIENIPPSHMECVKEIRADKEYIANYNKKNKESAWALHSRGEIILGKGADQQLDHEIGHAVFDKKIYIRGNEDKFKILNAYEASKKTGRGFPTPYSRESPKEYFAECYASYNRNATGFSKLNPPMGKILKGYWK